MAVVGEKWTLVTNNEWVTTIDKLLCVLSLPIAWPRMNLCPWIHSWGVFTLMLFSRCRVICCRSWLVKNVAGLSIPSYIWASSVKNSRSWPPYRSSNFFFKFNSSAPFNKLHKTRARLSSFFDINNTKEIFLEVENFDSLGDDLWFFVLLGHLSTYL